MIDKYLEIDSIEPNYWGKNGWIFLNSVALTYKTEYKDKYKLFFEQLPYILPCITCGQKLKDNIYSLDNALESKESLLIWLADIRNEVYIENGRPVKTVMQNINEIFDKSAFTDNKVVKMIIYIIFFIFLVCLYYNIKNKE
jgi:hypothetical protein